MSATLQNGASGNSGATRQLKNAWRRFLRVWDSMAIYMPLLMMGALALGTYWLARNTPALGPTAGPTRPRPALYKS